MDLSGGTLSHYVHTFTGIDTYPAIPAFGLPFSDETFVRHVTGLARTGRLANPA